MAKPPVAATTGPACSQPQARRKRWRPRSTRTNRSNTGKPSRRDGTSGSRARPAAGVAPDQKGGCGWADLAELRPALAPPSSPTHTSSTRRKLHIVRSPSMRRDQQAGTPLSRWPGTAAAQAGVRRRLRRRDRYAEPSHRRPGAGAGVHTRRGARGDHRPRYCRPAVHLWIIQRKRPDLYLRRGKRPARRLRLGKRSGYQLRTLAESLPPRPKWLDHVLSVRQHIRLAYARRSPHVRLVAAGQKCNARQLLREDVAAQQRWHCYGNWG